MPPLELVLALLVVVLALALIAGRARTPLPVLLAVGGLAIAIAGHYVPGMPSVVVPPNLVFFIFLPPLLVSAAFETPLGGLRRNARPIALLAIGLVLVTQGVVAMLARAIMPGLPWAPALVLGAIVAPPDAVAATAVAGRLGLPNRLVSIIAGEGLVNDATALVAFHLALGVVLTGAFAWSDAVLQFLAAAVFGVGTGLVLGWLTTTAQRHIDDPVIETTISLLAPYLGYLVADRIGGSGVLSVVTIGFFLRERVTQVGAARTRITQRTVWSVLVFLVNGLVFVLIGLDLGQLTAPGVSSRMVAAGAIVSAGVIVLRMAWMYGVPPLERLATLGHARSGVSSARARAVLGWAGMRGVISLAAALSIPVATAAGRPFPFRREIILITVAVIFATLVLQGLTLVPVIRALGLANPTAREDEEALARQRVLAAALGRLDALHAQGALTDGQRDLARRYEELRDGSAADELGVRAIGRAIAAMIEAKQAVVLRLRDDGHISDDTAQRLESELDLDAVRNT